MPLVMRSSAFRPMGEIPQQYTCDGEDRTPPLDWKDVPPGTMSFALIVDDHDAPDPKAPQKTFVHWVLYDLPASLRGLTVMANYPPGTRQGKNDLGRIGWTGPGPPIGRHRYFSSSMRSTWSSATSRRRARRSSKGRWPDTSSPRPR